MKIALLHFDLANGPKKKNKKKLLQGIKEASSHGAGWILTPETALEGYFFYKNDKNAPKKMSIRKQEDFKEFYEIAEQKQITLFLSAAEKTAAKKATTAKESVVKEDPAAKSKPVAKKTAVKKATAEPKKATGKAKKATVK